MAYQYLFAPTTQFQARTGANNTAGWLRVLDTQTDDSAPTYCDFGGTPNEERIVLDNDGRAIVIVDDSKTYRLEVYSKNGALMFTIDPLTAVGGGSGQSNIVQIISSDGTVSVSSNTAGGVRYFDLSVAIDDTAPSKWADRQGSASSVLGDGEWHELGSFVDIGTTSYDGGWKLSKKSGYDIAGSLEMVSGDSDALHSVDVKFIVELDGVAQVQEFGQVDPTKSQDRVSFEWKGEGNDAQVVNARVFVRSTEAVTPQLVSRVMFNEEADSIVGNDVGGDYIGGDYIEIVGTTINATGLQPSGDYVSSSEMSAYATTAELAEKLDASASSSFQPSGDYVSGDTFTAYTAGIDSSITNIQNNITSIESSISSLTGEYVELSSFSSYTASADSSYVHTGDMSGYATTAQLGEKLDASASSSFQPSGEYVSSSELANYQTTAGMSSYATTGDLAQKLDSSASSSFVTSTADCMPLSASSNYATTAALADKLDASAQVVTSILTSEVTSGSTPITTAVYDINGKPIKASFAIADDSGNNIRDTYATLDALSGKLDASAEVVTSLGIQWDEDTALIREINGSRIVAISAVHAPTNTAEVTAMIDSAVSGKLDASASSAFITSTADCMPLSSSSEFYSTSNPAGYITGVDLTPYAESSSLSAYQTTAGMSDYASTADLSTKLDASASSAFITSTADCMPLSASGNYATTAQLADKLDASASSSFMPASANPFTGVETDSSLTGNGLNGSSLGVNRTELIFDTSIVSSTSSSSVTIGVNTAILSGYAESSSLSAYATVSDLSSKLDTSASSSFMPESASGNYISTSEASSFIPESASAGFATTAQLADKLDSSSSSAFLTSTAGLVGTGDLSSYIDYSAIETSTAGITGINGSSIAGAGGPGGVVTSTGTATGDTGTTYVTSINEMLISAANSPTGDYVEKSALQVTIGSACTASGWGWGTFAQGRSALATDYALAQGYKAGASVNSLAQGSAVSAGHESMSQGVSSITEYNGFAQGSHNTARDNSFAQGTWCSASGASLAQGLSATASGASLAIGVQVTAVNLAAVIGAYNNDGEGSGESGVAFAIGDGFRSGTGTAATTRHNLFEIRKNGTVTVYSSTSDAVGTELVSTLSAKLDASASSSFVTSTADLMPSSASADFQTTADMSAYIPLSALGLVEI